MRTQLSERKIAPQHRKARLAGAPGQRHQEPRFAVRPRAMGQDDTLSAGIYRKVKESANGRLNREVRKLLLAALHEFLFDHEVCEAQPHIRSGDHEPQRLRQNDRKTTPDVRRVHFPA